MIQVWVNLYELPSVANGSLMRYSKATLGTYFKFKNISSKRTKKFV